MLRERSAPPARGLPTGALRKLSDAFAPGQRVWVSSLSTEPLLLQQELQEDPERAADVTFVGVQFPGIDTIDYLALHPRARQAGFFMSPFLRAGMAQGRADLMPMDYLAVARHLQESESIDVAVAQLTTPDAEGWCSPGPASDFLPLVWPRARRRVAQLNPGLPRTRGSFRVHVSELDGWVEAELPLHAYRDSAAGPIESAIGAHVAQLVRDGDTLQFGIGGVPMAVAKALGGHRQLRLITGMLGPSLRFLWESGALDRDARVLCGVLLGDAEFQQFAAALDPVWLTDVRHTHDPTVAGARQRFIAINGAVEVDLFGQVNSERANGVVQAGAGGLPAFAQAAWRSPGGRLVICLPATARRGTLSRIVPALGTGSLCTVPRHMADTVVTERGVAQLRGLSMDERAQALIRIAAPEHQQELERAWQAVRARI